MGINIKLDDTYYITDNSHNTAILVKKLGINKNGKHVEKKRYFPDFGRAIVAWARETGKSGENVTSFQKAAEIFDKKIEEAKTAINESCRFLTKKAKKMEKKKSSKSLKKNITLEERQNEPYSKKSNDW